MTSKVCSAPQKKKTKYSNRHKIPEEPGRRAASTVAVSAKAIPLNKQITALAMTFISKGKCNNCNGLYDFIGFVSQITY
jgi:hypothetical protein